MEDYNSTPLTIGRPLRKKKEHFCCFPIPAGLYLLFKFVFVPLISIGCDIVDLVSDFLVAQRHYVEAQESQGNYWRFGLTLGFIFAPSVFFALFAVYKVLKKDDKSFVWRICHVVIYTVAVFTLSLWPIYSYLKMLCYGVKAMRNRAKRKEYEEKIEEIKQSSDFTTQNIMRAFLQCMPQVLLQLYIMLTVLPDSQNSITVTIQIGSVVLSLINVTATVIKFHNQAEHDRQVTLLEPKSKQGEICCVFIEFLWWYLSISSRVIALALFASVYHFWVLALCLGHTLIMSACIIKHQMNRDCGKIIVAFFVGVMYVFCFVEYKGNFNKIAKIISLHIIYYIFTLPQNSFMVLMSYFALDTPEDYHLPLVIGHFLASSLALIFMLCYLGILRPFQHVRNQSN